MTTGSTRPRAPGASRALARLRRIFSTYEPASATRKLELLGALARGRLETARAVLGLHEILCFLRAYPDDARVLAAVEGMLGRFDRRADLRAHRHALRQSGIAGTELRFTFFAGAALHLAQRWPERLSIAWEDFDARERLGWLLPLLTHPAERAAFDAAELGARPWLERFARGREAAFLVLRWHELAADEPIRSALYDDFDPPLRLAPGPDTPCRTREKLRLPSRELSVHYQTRPLARARPDLATELRRPPASVRAVSPREADAFIQLARDTMLPRERDLEVFAYASRADVRLVDAGDGLAFACIGVLPERRSLLEAVYGFLMLKNGVAVGYALASALYASSEIAFNVFETFRGGEAARTFGRLCAAVHALFGSDAFSVEPYQLGHDNDEGLGSGAFWFYQKLGFRPVDRDVVALMQRELGRMRARPGHRSSLATLRRLVRAHVFWPAPPRRRDVLGLLSVANVALHVSRHLQRYGADRERAQHACLAEAALRLGVAPAEVRRWAPAERQAWERWAPLVSLLPGVERWSRAERRALALVVRAKGAAEETDFVQRFQAHRRLRAAVLALAERPLALR
jgi:hypothetical protein